MADSLARTKQAMRRALAVRFQSLAVPDEAAKRVEAQRMRVVASLRSGATAILGCAEVKRGLPPGRYALYWVATMSGGEIPAIMAATGLDASPAGAPPHLFTTTSHNLSDPSHFAVGPDSDFAAVAAAIGDDLVRHAFPLIAGFASTPAMALDLILRGCRMAVRNPFTTCIILMHQAGQTERLDEIIRTAASRQGFYDFPGEAQARARIALPLSIWFRDRR